MPNVVKCRVVFDKKPSWAPSLVRTEPLNWGYSPEPRHSFDYWVPRPANLLSQYQSTFSDLSEVLGEKAAKHLDEIEWMRREWGTSGDGWAFQGSRKEGGYVLDFNAAWSAPVPVFLAMAKKDGPLRASWYEEFGHHAGHLRFETSATENGLVVATEVVKVYRGRREGYRGESRIMIGERFSFPKYASVEAYLSELRDELWGKDSEVPLVRGEFDD